jgi:hypothetical protein
MVWPENERERAVYAQQGRDFMEEDAEQERLGAIAQVQSLRMENLSYKNEAKKAAKLRKALALTPLVLAMGLAALPNFKKESTHDRVAEEIYAVIFGILPVGAAEGIRSGRIKRSKDMAKDAHQINVKIGRNQDRWILEDLGQAHSTDS